MDIHRCPYKSLLPWQDRISFHQDKIWSRVTLRPVAILKCNVCIMFINNSIHVILQRITQEKYAYFLRGYNEKNRYI